jgi:hypothetical protein
MNAQTRAINAAQRIDDAVRALADAYRDLKDAAGEISKAGWRVGGAAAVSDVHAVLLPTRLPEEIRSALEREGLDLPPRSGYRAAVEPIAQLWADRLSRLPDPAGRQQAPNTPHLTPGQKSPTAPTTWHPLPIDDTRRPA